VRSIAVVPSLSLVAGAGLGLLAPDAVAMLAPLCLAAAVAAALYAWRFARPWELALWTSLAFIGGGALLSADAWQQAAHSTLRAAFDRLQAAERRTTIERGRAAPDDPGAATVVTGVLTADASPRAGGVVMALAVESIRGAEGAEERVAGGVSLTVAGEAAATARREWRAGRRVRVPAHLRRPSRYLNPGVADEERAMNRRGVVLVGSVKSGALVEVVAPGPWLAEAAATTRQFVRDAVVRHVGRWSEQSAGIVTAILIGDRAGLSVTTTRRLQEAGTYHVIAISGGNIAILAALTLAAFRVAGWLGRWAMAAAIAGLLAYWYVVGGGASVTRATLMAVLYFAARAADLRAAPFQTLALVAALFVAAQPLAVADAGFLLTVVATGGIVAVAPAAGAFALPRLLSAPAALLAASVAAELALLPIGALLFARITLAGLVLNFAAIPLMALVQGAGMALVLLSPVMAPAATFVGRIASLAAEGLVRSAEFVDVAPFVTWRVAPPSSVAVAAYYVALAFLVLAIRPLLSGSRWTARRGPSAGAAAAAALAAVWVACDPMAPVRARGDGLLHVTFLDVGQGDAALVRFPRGTAWMVDAGGLPSGSSFDVGERVVAPVLRASGIGRLDTLVITHGDADHAGGALSLLQEFRPRDVWEGVPVPRLAPLQALRAVAAAHQARWVNVQGRHRLSVDDVEVLVHHPPTPDWERQDVRNDDSVVLELRRGDVSIVLTGDIGREAEHGLLASFAPAPIRIVKVPHHGSRTSSSAAFVGALRPAAAVVSVGRSNTFGHPAPDVLARYSAIGAAIFRTDQDGAIMLRSDGRSAEIGTHLGRSRGWRAPAR
jgi:competence protein ComEC